VGEKGEKEKVLTYLIGEREGGAFTRKLATEREKRGKNAGWGPRKGQLVIILLSGKNVITGLSLKENVQGKKKKKGMSLRQAREDPDLAERKGKGERIAMGKGKKEPRGGKLFPTLRGDWERGDDLSC